MRIVWCTFALNLRDLIQMYTLKIIVELPDKFKPAITKQVYRNIVTSDTLDFPYNELFRTFKFLYGNEAIINFSLI